MALTSQNRTPSEQPKPSRKLPPGTCWAPAPWDPADATAVQQVLLGRATEDQQKRAMKWVIEAACATYDFHYHPSERDTAFALGRAFVGQQIVKLSRLNVSRMRSNDNDNGNND
jgi:hypothetical protein